MMMVWMWERGNVVVGNRDDAVRADARNRDAKCRIFKKGCENKRKFRVCTLPSTERSFDLTDKLADRCAWWTNVVLQFPPKLS